MADTADKRQQAATTPTTPTTAPAQPTLIRIEAGDGRDYPADRNRANDDNRNCTVAVMVYRLGPISFKLNVYGSFSKGRKAETLAVKLPPSVPKSVEIHDDGQFLSAATESFVTWIKANSTTIAETAKRSGGQSLADLLK